MTTIVTMTMPSQRWVILFFISTARNVTMFTSQVIFMILFITFRCWFSLFLSLFFFTNSIWNAYCNGFDWNDYYRSQLKWAIKFFSLILSGILWWNARAEQTKKKTCQDTISTGRQSKDGQILYTYIYILLTKWDVSARHLDCIKVWLRSSAASKPVDVVCLSCEQGKPTYIVVIFAQLSAALTSFSIP